MFFCGESINLHPTVGNSIGETLGRLRVKAVRNCIQSKCVEFEQLRSLELTGWIVTQYERWFSSNS